MGTTTKSKLERVKARLSEAVRDVRENGRQGRSIAEIAGQFRCKPGTLKVKLSEAGLLGPLTPALELAKSRRIEKQAEAASGSDSLEIKGLSAGIAAGGEIQGREGGNPLKGGTGASGEAGAGDSRLDAINESVRSLVLASFRASGRFMELKSWADVDRAYRLLKETYKPVDGESSGPGRGLIQVQILGDASAPAPRSVRVIEAKSELISDSPIDSVPVSLPSQAAQGEG